MTRYFVFLFCLQRFAFTCLVLLRSARRVLITSLCLHWFLTHIKIINSSQVTSWRRHHALIRFACDLKVDDERDYTMLALEAG